MSYGEELRIRVPRGVKASLVHIAEEEKLSVPEFLRRIVRAELEGRRAQIGVDVSQLDWVPRGQHLPEVSTRRTLPPEIAAGIHSGLQTSGLSLRQAAELVGIDNSYLCRLAQGTRFPSHAVAARLVVHLPIDDETADALLDLTKNHNGV